MDQISMVKVYYSASIDELLGAFDFLGIEDFNGAKILVKLHMGEPGNPVY